MKFSGLDSRLKRLERLEVDTAVPWPPLEGSFSAVIWERLGRPKDQLTFGEMYSMCAKKHYESDLNERTEKTYT